MRFFNFAISNGLNVCFIVVVSCVFNGMDYGNSATFGQRYVASTTGGDHVQYLFYFTFAADKTDADLHTIFVVA